MKAHCIAKMAKIVSLGLCLGGSNMALASDPHPLDASAKQTVKSLGGALMKEVKGAMKAEGPVGAIAACNTQAIPLTDQASRQQGMDISRTALRVRNQDNQADQWEQGVLEQFQARQANGEPLKGMHFSEVVEQDGKQVYRMMQAIPTQKACLTCHGSEIKPEVATKLNALYPLDKATGFAEGDLRGAFSVRKVL
ncbi:MAG: DUF3365 domain-containing protein [Halopseudomonas sp.]